MTSVDAWAQGSNDQQRKDAQEFQQKAQQARDTMEAIGKSLRATVELDRALIQRGNAVADSAGLSRKLAAWKSLAGALVTPGARVNDKYFGSYPKATLEAANAVKAAGAYDVHEPAVELKSSKQVAESTLDLLFRAYDAALLEQGMNNRMLRTYPYSELARQSPVDCDAVNVFTRDVKCLPASSHGVQSNGAWLAGSVDLSEFCRSKKLEPFPREQYGSKLVFVRKRSPFIAQLAGDCRD